MSPDRSSSVLLLAKSGPEAQAIVQNLTAVRLPVDELAWQADHDMTDYAAEAAVAAQKAGVVIIDLQALGDHGITLCERLNISRGSHLELPKLVTLGVEGDEQLEHAAFQVGCDAVVRRPFSHIDLLERLRTLDVWKMRQTHRVRMTIPVVWERPDGQTCNGETLDVSEGGLQFRSEQPIPVGQNVPIQVKLEAAAPPLSVWARVMRCKPLDEPDAEFTAAVAVNFLNLTATGRELLASTVGRVREQEETIARAMEEAQTIANDHRIGQIVEWFLFLLNPAAFGGPPPPVDIDQLTLKRSVYRLAPHEERLFLLEDARPAPVPDDVRWLRAWAAFRPDLRQLAEEAERKAAWSVDRVVTWLKRARAALELLDSSLMVWDHFRRHHDELDVDAAERSLLLTLREAIEVRDHYNELRDEGDPQFFTALTRAEDYFAKRDYDAAELVRYDRHAIVSARLQKRRRKERSHKEEVEPAKPRPWRTIAGVAFIVAGGAYALINGLSGEENRLAVADDVQEISPLLESGSYSQGKSRIFVGRVKLGEWNMLSRKERKSEARRIRDRLAEREIFAAMIYQKADDLAMHIDKQEIIFVE